MIFKTYRGLWNFKLRIDCYKSIKLETAHIIRSAHATQRNAIHAIQITQLNLTNDKSHMMELLSVSTSLNVLHGSIIISSTKYKWPGGDWREGHGDFIPTPSGHSPLPLTRKSPGGSSRILLTWEISLGLGEIWF